MNGYELCIDTDQPGGGARYATLEDAKVAGWEEIGPVEGDRNPTILPLQPFFTVHEFRADGAAPILMYDSRNRDE